MTSRPVQIDNCERSQQSRSLSSALLSREESLGRSLIREYALMRVLDNDHSGENIADSSSVSDDNIPTQPILDFSFNQSVCNNYETQTDRKYDRPPKDGEDVKEEETESLLVHFETKGKSSFAHSTFNAVNVLIGIGILSLPLSFSHGGWLFGSGMLILCALITNYTAIVLQWCLDYEAGINSYADIGYHAFGKYGRYFIVCVFTAELFIAAVTLVILIGDSLHYLSPSLPITTWKVIAFAVITPSTWINSLRIISYTSFIGIVSIFYLFIALLINGLWSDSSPGSLKHPMPTLVLPDKWTNLPSIIGLSMAGFAGHAIFPTIYRDMKSPRQYKSMVTLSYSCALLIYFGVGVCGYLMYGRDAKDEITKNIKGNSSDKHWMSIVNILALILIVINPITKYSLMIIPITFDFTKRISGRASAGHYKRKFLTIGIRTLVSALVLVAALVFPRFDVVMNFMGSLLSFTVSLTFPCVCYLKLYFSELGMLSRLFHCSLALFGAFMSLAGSIWSIIPHKIT